MILPNIVEFFVYGQAFDKKYSEHASKSFIFKYLEMLFYNFKDNSWVRDIKVDYNKKIFFYSDVGPEDLIVVNIFKGVDYI